MNKLGIYIHWPYCISKCPYCDFNSHKIKNYDPNEWLSAYENQIKYFKEYLLTQNFKNIKLSSIFFGGGTPSLMPPKLVEEILLFINKHFNFDENIEITLESNPTNLELNKIRDFKLAGVNRVSLGVQGLNDTDLKYLGRLHNASETFVVLDLMQKIIDNISVDLIYALPCQNLEIWNHELQTFLKNFPIKHLSAYQLVIEKGTKFHHLFNKGELKTVSDNTYQEFYFCTKNILKDNVELLDLGAGSGSIGISAKLETKNKVNLHLSDISKRCVQGIKKNLQKFDIQANVYLSNWFENIPNIKFDLIISNPPYISYKDPHLNELHFEPKHALVSKNDGLADIQKIIRKI